MCEEVVEYGSGVAALGAGTGEVTIQAGDDEIPALREIAEDYTADTGVEVRFIEREINAQAISNFIARCCYKMMARMQARFRFPGLR